jgi:diguanylate cyclase (GGDEF)-like protein
VKRPLSNWVLVGALLLVGTGAVVAGNELRVSTENKATASAELNADAVIALSVGRNFTHPGELRPGSTLEAREAEDMQTDVDVLVAKDLLLGLEVWRLDGSLAFADAAHPPDELKLPEEERLRAREGGFVQAGDRDERGVASWEVFRRYDADGDGTVDGTVEVILPATGQAQVEQVTRRLYLALALLVLLVAAGLLRFNRRLAQREHEARHDPLTGLGNRLALSLRHESLRRSPEPTEALILLDLDGFKAVNDTLGHQAGDQLLVQVARTLSSLVRPTDLVARLGGDEFALLLGGPQTRETALRTARHVVDGLAKHGFAVEGVSLDVHASAGVALRPDDADDAAGLLQRADVAMYQAKSRGCGVVAYDVDQDPHDVPKLQLLAQLRYAIDHDELVLHYQPKVDLQTGQVRGIEALVRWQHPDRGLLPPDDFVPMAEHTALIHSLTSWVLDRACRQAVAWDAEGTSLAVAVNISPRSLLNGDLPALVLKVLTTSGLPPRLLELEITETAMVVDPDGAQLALQQLRTMGVRVSLDDFGTGYTSMALLQTLPVTALKIDRAFVTGMLASRDDSAVAESLISLANRLGLEVVAEGVETADVVDRLRTLGCDQAQGFHLAYPMPAEQVADWLIARPDLAGRTEATPAVLG